MPPGTIVRDAASGETDYVALFAVTCGTGVRQLAEKWKDEWEPERRLAFDWEDEPLLRVAEGGLWLSLEVREPA